MANSILEGYYKKDTRKGPSHNSSNVAKVQN